MRFLVDECTGPLVARSLREQGHDVLSVYEDARGIDDDSVIAMAQRENRILITNDKDFGEKVYREHRPHHGVILLRLEDERPANAIRVIQRLLQGFANQLPDRFVVASDSQVRFAEQ